MVDGTEFRQVMGRFATGVTVVTTRGADGAPYGLTANAVASISLEPPLVMISIDKRAETFPHFLASRAFVINVLAAGQEALSNRFAKSGGDKFAGLAYETNAEGVPVFPDTLATIECRIVATHEAGDHVIHLGEVDATRVTDAAPLLYFHGHYGRFAG
jgi:3-hydroxy-9,10-secoandrosta-1,3,5(10)-triene-9,17-dione monooxygenase reductase component